MPENGPGNLKVVVMRARMVLSRPLRVQTTRHSQIHQPDIHDTDAVSACQKPSVTTH